MVKYISDINVMKDFILKSNIFLSGLKSTSKNGIRKYFTNFGLKSHNVEAVNNIKESIEPLSEKEYNIVFIDDDAEDIKDINKVIEIVTSKCPDKSNRLLGLFAKSENQNIIDLFYNLGGDLHIQKPYTMEVFEKSLESYFQNLDQQKKFKLKEEKKNKEFSKKAKNAYKDFKEEFENQKDDYEEKFQGACETFLQSLETKVDENALTNILNIGLEFKNFQALHLFVQAWIQIFPIHDEDVADVTRVLIYNKNFNLMNSISPKEQSARIALGAGMVVAAMANQHRKSEKLNETIIQLITKGLELSNFKNIITQKALEVLINIEAKEMASEIFNLEIVQENLSSQEEIYNDIKQKLSA